MDPSPWSPYSQQYSHLGSGSPQRSLVLPSPLPREDSINSYGGNNSHPLLMSSCQGLPPLPPRPSTADPAVRPTALLNSRYDQSILSPPLHSSKEPQEYFNDNLYNGVCKESQTAIRSFIQTSGSSTRNENSGFNGSENSNSGFNTQVPPLSFHSTSIDRPSPGPFGVLPHEAVMTRSSRFERSNEKFIAPVSKSVATSFTSGSYTEQDVNNSYASPSLPTQTPVFLNDNASHSPVVNPVTSPSMSNFSSPNDYYSSPKPSFGTYNSMQSPLAQSPSVAQHSYPSSPFTSVDPVGHISSAPPCSPLNSGTYVNNLPERGVIVSQVPQRNGQKSQHSPNSGTGGSSVICYNPQQSQSMAHHGHAPSVSKTPDYHADYGVFSRDQNISPSSYPSVYPAMHSSQTPGSSGSRISPRTHSQLPSSSHDNRLSYALPSSLPSSSISSPTYLQNKASGIHESSFSSCSSNIASGQPIHPPSYPQCSSVIDSIRPRPIGPNSSSIMPNHLVNDRQFGYSSDLTDDKNALDIFNSHVDSGVHNPDSCQSSISNFLENDLPILEPDVLTNRPMRISESSHHQSHQRMLNMEVTGRGIIAHTHMSTMHNNGNNELIGKSSMNYAYDTSMNMGRSVPYTFSSAPRKRGRRGRRRKSDVSCRDGYPFPSFKSERNIIYSNGYPANMSKFPDYGNNNCYGTYPNSHKQIYDSSEFLHSHYPSPYLPSFKSEIRNCSNLSVKDKKSYPSIEDDLKFLGKFSFVNEDEDKEVPHTFMKTRNKDCEGFLQSFLNFLEIRKSNPESEGDSGTAFENSKCSKDHKGRSRNVPKVIIKMGRCNNPGEWRLTETHVSPERFSDSSEESVSFDSNGVSSHNEVKSEDRELSSRKNGPRAVNTGNVRLASEKLLKFNAKRSFEYIDGVDKYSELGGNHLPLTNSETLPAGKVKAKGDCGGGIPRIASYESEKKVPKKRGRKAKNAPGTTTNKQKTRCTFAKDEIVESGNGSSLPNSQEIPLANPIERSREEGWSSRKSSLRARKDDFVVKEEQFPGPSIKSEPINLPLSSDDDALDDSDSDPAWTPSARTPKALEPPKSHSSLENAAKKCRRKRVGRRNSTSSTSVLKKKREKPSESCKTKLTILKSKTPNQRKEKSSSPQNLKMKPEKKTDTFLIAKTDLNKDKPPSLWRLDSEMSLLQRFDPYEEQGIQLHRQTYTYAAWNEVSEHNYVRADIKVLSCSRVLYVIQYSGLQTSEAPSQNSTLPQPAILNPLRENFEVFLQTLISQALDPNFLSEITNENDEYFLSNIKEIEKVTEDKKKLLVKDTWDQELRKCADIYPCVNILAYMDGEDVKCQVCGAAKSEKLLQFYGQPYDWTTLGSIETPVASKTQFNVCAICSATVSLYSRLHHQKYNFFIKCRSKMNQVKGDNESVESHVLLEHCLQDSGWVNQLFLELENIWKECGKTS